MQHPHPRSKSKRGAVPVGPAKRKGQRKQVLPLSRTTPRVLDLERHLPYRVAIVANLLALDRDPLVRKLSTLGLRELRVLLNVGSYMPVRATDIAYQTRLGLFTVSRAVAVLLRSRLIVSTPDAEDARVQWLSLTDAGGALYDGLSRTVEERARRVAAVLTAREQAVFLEFLGRIEDSAEQVLAEEALATAHASDDRLSADQQELLRWYKRSSE